MESSAESEADASESEAVEEPSSEEKAPTLRSEVPRITVEELKERLDNGESIMIADTRSTTLFNVNHIVGAISAPESEILSQLEDVPLDEEIILYCY
jgi:3-mercaptopyruvate sulfurtransferase SseA